MYTYTRTHALPSVLCVRGLEEVEGGICVCVSECGCAIKKAVCATCLAWWYVVCGMWEVRQQQGRVAKCIAWHRIAWIKSKQS